MNVLFVDDDPNVLQGLQRMLRSVRNEWSMQFAASGADALARLAAQQFDVVVSDVKMPGMDGVQLLNEVKRHYPTVVRIILSGHADRQTLHASLGPAHQYLSKPCDAATIIDTVRRSHGLLRLIDNPELQGLLSRMDALPSLPQLYSQIMEELRSEDPSAKRVGEIVAQDVAMAAKVLQVVNSAYCGLGQPIGDPVRAVGYLGTETIKTLALTGKAFEALGQGAAEPAELETLWRHCFRVAVVAKGIAADRRLDTATQDTIFQAGFLHEIGALVVDVHLRAEAREVRQRIATQGLTRYQAEQQVLGTTHAELGAYLLGLWGLPGRVVEAIALHHTPAPSESPGLTPALAIQIADGLVLEATGSCRAPAHLAAAEAAGLGEHLPALRALAQQTLQGEHA